MSGEERRNRILCYLTHQNHPVSGTALAREFGVSRQVIVQDIALLRSGQTEIISTNRGYLIPAFRQAKPQRIIKCFHSDAQTEDELTCIVDQGGTVETVFVHHKIYGRIEAEMSIRSRRDVREFLNRIHSGKSSLLKNVTSDYHYHTISAENELILDDIERELDRRGYLVKQRKEVPIDGK